MKKHLFLATVSLPLAQTAWAHTGPVGHVHAVDLLAAVGLSVLIALATRRLARVYKGGDSDDR
ncbi:MAG: hypothetical protein ACK5ME_12300 [Parahaliea sp.]